MNSSQTSINLNNVSFRRTSFDDAKKMWKYTNVFYEGYRHGFDIKIYVCITAFLNKTPIAFSVKTLNNNLPKNSSYLSYTYVKKKYRGNGLAKKLSNAMLKHGRFVLQISPLNLISLSSHIHMGFEIINLDLSHIRGRFIDISDKDSWYKVKIGTDVPIEDCDAVNQLFRNKKVDEIEFINNSKSMGKINSHYKYYAGMYNLKFKRDCRD